MMCLLSLEKLSIQYPRLTTGITIAQSGDFGKRLNAKPKVDDVAVLHYVFLALQAQKPPLFGGSERAAGH